MLACIIGLPAIRASGLPGNLVEANLAGMMATVLRLFLLAELDCLHAYVAAKTATVADRPMTALIIRADVLLEPSLTAVEALILNAIK